MANNCRACHKHLPSKFCDDCTIKHYLECERRRNAGLCLRCGIKCDGDEYCEKCKEKRTINSSSETDDINKRSNKNEFDYSLMLEYLSGTSEPVVEKNNLDEDDEIKKEYEKLCNEDKYNGICPFCFNSDKDTTIHRSHNIKNHILFPTCFKHKNDYNQMIRSRKRHY